MTALFGRCLYERIFGRMNTWLVEFMTMLANAHICMSNELFHARSLLVSSHGQYGLIDCLFGNETTLVPRKFLATFK